MRFTSGHKFFTYEASASVNYGTKNGKLGNIINIKFLSKLY